MYGLACSAACGFCGRCTPKGLGPSVNDAPGAKASDLPVPIPGMGERIEAEKARRRARHDETFQRAIQREFRKPPAA